MKKNKGTDENAKVFRDHSLRSWYTDGDNIKVGDSLANIMRNESETLEVKEIIYGDSHNTFKIVVTTDEKIHLLKTSRECK